METTNSIFTPEGMRPITVSKTLPRYFEIGGRARDLGTFKMKKQKDKIIRGYWAEKISFLTCLLVVAGCCISAEAVPRKIFREERAIQQTAKWTENWWMPRFEKSKAAASNENVKVVFLGDSITHNWESKGAAIWKKYFADGDYKGVNCGFAGDCTEHVIWRLENGQIDGCPAKAVCLMIGTNNTAGRSMPGCTARGVKRIIDMLQEKLPDARIVLLPIFPRGAEATDANRLTNDAVNREIRSFADGKKVIWLDFTGTMVDAEGLLSKATAGDLLHPEAGAYEIWAERLIPVLDDIFAGKENIEPVAEPAFSALPPTGFDMPVKIWPDGKAPDNATVDGCSELYFFQPLETRPDPACLIIVSGGGYSGNDPKSNEAYGAAKNFLLRGIHVAILNYRTKRLPDKPVWWASFQDAQRAIRVVKENASRYGYATNNVSFCGYSAGGHLTLLVATSGMTETYEPMDDIDRRWTPQLKHAIPVYPAYVCGFVGKDQVRGCEVDNPIAPEFKFDAWTPPMTLFHGDLDGHTAMASVKIYTELRRRNIPAELHVFGGMNHGFGGSIRAPAQNTWSYSGWELHAANRLTRYSADIHRWPDQEE